MNATLPNKLQNVVGDVKFETAEKVQSPTKPYWAILDQNCPLDSVTFGNVTFHKSVEKALKGGKVATLPGQLLWLTDEDVQLVREGLQTDVLRIFYTTDPETKIRTRSGQKRVSARRWSRPGFDRNGVPFNGPDGKILEKPILVPMPKGYTPSNTDVPFTNYVRLQQVTPDLLPYLQQIMGLEVTEGFFDDPSNPLGGLPSIPGVGAVGVVDHVADARAFNEQAAAQEQSLSAEAGVSRRKRGGTTMGRED